MTEKLLSRQPPKGSHGRGGVGNIGPTVNDAKNPLVTPTIKTNTYTTGRGGSGNMKKNDPKHPEIARRSQDVGPTMYSRRGSDGVVHTGRGGAANIMRNPSVDETMLSADENAVIEEGMLYNRQRKEAGVGSGIGGDWWRDELAEGKAVVKSN